MKSRLAEQAKEDLAAYWRGKSAQQRLNAFLAHSQLVVALGNAGSRARLTRQKIAALDAN